MINEYSQDDSARNRGLPLLRVRSFNSKIEMFSSKISAQDVLIIHLPRDPEVWQKKKSVDQSSRE
jgi:hypothetical protein